MAKGKSQGNRWDNLQLHATMAPYGHPQIEKENPFLVGGRPTPLKNMSSSVGIIVPNMMGKNKIHVPNHQPESYFSIFSGSPKSIH